MYIYNVTIKIEKDIEQEWLCWMQEKHMQDVVNTGLYSRYSFYKLIEPNDDEAPTYIAQYHTDSLEKYKQYSEEFGPKLKEEGINKFGDKFVAFRTILQKMD